MIDLKEFLIALKIYVAFAVAVTDCSDVDTLIKVYKELNRLEPETEIEKALHKDIFSLIKERVKVLMKNDD